MFYFGLLTGATLGGNLTPIGASANIAAIGILRKNGETVRLRDFLRIGVPFTLSARARRLHLHLARLGHLICLGETPSDAKTAFTNHGEGGFRFAPRRSVCGGGRRGDGCRAWNGKARALRACETAGVVRAPCLRRALSSMRGAAECVKARVHARALPNILFNFSPGFACLIRKRSFPYWKEQSCLVVRMDKSPSENLNFSAQYVSTKRTRQAMCSDPTSRWYNGIAS